MNRKRQKINHVYAQTILTKKKDVEHYMKQRESKMQTNKQNKQRKHE